MDYLLIKDKLKIFFWHTFPGYFCKARLRKRCKSHFGEITRVGVEGEGRDFLLFGSKLAWFCVSGGECLCPLASQALLSLRIHTYFDSSHEGSSSGKKITYKDSLVQ